MRIAFLSIGNHIHTERWLEYFVAKGHDVHLITVTPGPIEGVTHHDLRTGIPWKPLHYAVGVLKLRSILRRIKPDLLHTHFLQGYGYWSVFAGVKPFVLTVWGDDVYKAPFMSKVRGLLSRRAIAMADAITGDSDDILAVVEKLGAPREKLHHILWGVDFNMFYPRDGSEMRAQWRVPDEAPIVISTRSFSRDYYNIDVIVDSVALVARRIPNVVFVFAAYDGEAGDLKSRAKRLGVGDNVRFVGRIAHDRLPLALGAADAFVTVPSLDATAVSLLEAMSCAKGIVASDLPSNREWITDGENGFIVPPRDADALAACIVRLIEDPALRTKLGERSMGIAHARAGFEENMSRIEAICEDLVERSR